MALSSGAFRTPKRGIKNIILIIVCTSRTPPTQFIDSCKCENVAALQVCSVAPGASETVSVRVTCAFAGHGCLACACWLILAG